MTAPTHTTTISCTLGAWKAIHEARTASLPLPVPNTPKGWQVPIPSHSHVPLIPADSDGATPAPAHQRQDPAGSTPEVLSFDTEAEPIADGREVLALQTLPARTDTHAYLDVMRPTAIADGPSNDAPCEPPALGLSDTPPPTDSEDEWGSQDDDWHDWALASPTDTSDTEVEDEAGDWWLSLDTPDLKAAHPRYGASQIPAKPLPDFSYVMRLTPEEQLATARTYAAQTLQDRQANEDAAVVSALMDRVPTSATPAEQDMLRQCLRDNYDVFALNNSQLGHCTWVEMDIDTGDATPIAIQPYRMSRVELEALHDEVERLLAAGVIRPSCSPWCAPVIMIPKGPGKGYRCVLDYRMLNSVTKPVQWPMGHVDEQVQRLTPNPPATRRFSSMDAVSGFFQLELNERSRECTAFAVPTASRLGGQYEFCRAAQGLRSSPAYYCRAMQAVLRPLLNISVQSWVDDVAAYADNIQDHCRVLSDVFTLLRISGLRVSVDKFECYTPELTFLGHAINGTTGEIKPAAKHIANLKKYPQLRTPRQVKAFLGITGYFRCWVKDYASIARPLYNLCSPRTQWRWGDEEQSAYEQLRDALTSEPILRAPDWGRQFELSVDWARHAVAACLSQRDDQGREYVVSYASKRLTGPALNWASVDGEAFAAVFGVTRFHPFLYGTGRFILYTDHSAIKFLLTSKNLTGKLARLAMRLMQYDMEIRHRPGATNSVADGLTRLELEDCFEPPGLPAEEQLPTDPCTTGLDLCTTPSTFLASRCARPPHAVTTTSHRQHAIEIMLSDGITDSYRGVDREWLMTRYLPARPAAAAPRGVPIAPPVPPQGPEPRRVNAPMATTTAARQPANVASAPAQDVPTPTQPILPPTQPTNSPKLPTSEDDETEPPSQETAAGGDNGPRVRFDVGDRQVPAATTAAAADAKGKRYRQPNRLLQDYAPHEPTSSDDSVRCLICGEGQPANNLVLCDAPGETHGCHTDCLTPALRAVPKGKWFCPDHAAERHATATAKKVAAWRTPKPLTMATQRAKEAAVAATAVASPCAPAPEDGSLAQTTGVQRQDPTQAGPSGSQPSHAPSAPASGPVTTHHPPVDDSGSDSDYQASPADSDTYMSEVSLDPEDESGEGEDEGSDWDLEEGEIREGTWNYGTRECAVWNDRELLDFLRTKAQGTLILAPNSRVARKAQHYFWKDDHLYRTPTKTRPAS